MIDVQENTPTPNQSKKKADHVSSTIKQLSKNLASRIIPNTPVIRLNSNNLTPSTKLKKLLDLNGYIDEDEDLPGEEMPKISTAATLSNKVSNLFKPKQALNTNNKENEDDGCDLSYGKLTLLIPSLKLYKIKYLIYV